MANGGIIGPANIATSSVAKGVWRLDEQWSYKKANTWPLPETFALIQTQTVGAGGTGTITFSSVPQNYKHLQVRGMFLAASGSGYLGLRFNGDTAANYSEHYLYGDGASAASGGGGAQSKINIHGITTNSWGASNPVVMVLDLLDYTSTSKYKTSRNLAGIDQNGSGEIVLHSGSWRSTAAVTEVNLFCTGTLNQYSTFSLYGVM